MFNNKKMAVLRNFMKYYFKTFVYGMSTFEKDTTSVYERQNGNGNLYSIKFLQKQYKAMLKMSKACCNPEPFHQQKCP